MSTPAQEARAIRKALKVTFPGQKFFVNSKSYSMGSSVDIEWMDGPTSGAVEAVLPSGKGFDGMIDMAFYQDDYLMPDGTFVLAGTDGTGGSRGSVPSVQKEKPHPDATRVCFTSYITTCRKFSAEALQAAVNTFSEKWSATQAPLIDGNGYWYVGAKLRKEKTAHFVRPISLVDGDEWAYRECSDIANKMSLYIKPEPKNKATKKAVRVQAAKKYASKPVASEDGIEIVHSGTWTWLYLTDEPEQPARDSLQAIGFKYDKKRSAIRGHSCWYAKELVEETAVKTAVQAVA